VISELTLTEVISAVGRRREGVISATQAARIRDALFADADSGSFRRIDLAPPVHRLAERILFSTESILLRTLDALHIALAPSGEAKRLVTFEPAWRTPPLCTD
jgi:predicted nucleic acid-binding protein